MSDNHELRTRQVRDAVISERDYQNRKWPNHDHTLDDWILILRKMRSELEMAWVNGHGNADAVNELRQTVTVAAACLQQCDNGYTFDVPDDLNEFEKMNLSAFILLIGNFIDLASQLFHADNGYGLNLIRKLVEHGVAAMYQHGAPPREPSRIPPAAYERYNKRGSDY